MTLHRAGSAAPVGVPVPAGPAAALSRGFAGAFLLRGRSSRREYWWFALLTAAAVAAAVAVESALGGSGLVAAAVTLVVVAPSISVCVRRLHDAGYAGGWFFIGLLPFIGVFWLVILLVQPSQRLGNRFGPGPEDSAPR